MYHISFSANVEFFMINEYLAPNMKRKVLQQLVIQDTQVKTFSKLSDFNASQIVDTETDQSKNLKEYDYFYFPKLKVNKLESVVFGFASDLIEKLTPSSLILSFGMLKYSNTKNTIQTKDFSNFGEELSFSQIPPLNATELYFVLYPHSNHLALSNDEIQFQISYLNGGVSTETNLPMKYLPPTYIDREIPIGFKYLKEVKGGMYWEREEKYEYTAKFFSRKVLSNGVYISDQLITYELWINILYPQNKLGEHTVLKNWWKPISDLDPNSEFYKTRAQHYPIDIVESQLVEYAVWEDVAPPKYQLEDPVEIKESITKVFHFCNLLSMKCGLEPYYEFIDVSEDGSGNPSNSSKIWPKKILFKSQANGFRLPTSIELEEVLLREKKECLEYIQQNPNSDSDIELTTQYELTQDSMTVESINAALDEIEYIFDISNDVNKSLSSHTYQLDKVKLKAKIKEISNSKTYKDLDGSSRLLIDPKIFPTDQPHPYIVFTQLQFLAKRLDFDIRTNPITKRSMTDFKIENKGYNVQHFSYGMPTDSFSFRIVKNKI